MSSLTYSERRILESVFRMGSGYVLTFSNRTFADFILDVASRDIYGGLYSGAGSSKANHLREFWRLEEDRIVSALIDAMAKLGRKDGTISDDDLATVMPIVERLRAATVVSDAAAIAPNTSEPTFALLARAAREAVEAGKPEEALDRLHTFTTKYIRALATKRGITIDKSKPLHSVFGEYVKALRQAGAIESEMADRILKSTISTLEAFNHVRNDQSLAHDNPVLRTHEAAFIVNHITSLVRLLQAIDHGATALPDAEA